MSGKATAHGRMENGSVKKTHAAFPRVSNANDDISSEMQWMSCDKSMGK